MILDAPKRLFIAVVYLVLGTAADFVPSASNRTLDKFKSNTIVLNKSRPAECRDNKSYRFNNIKKYSCSFLIRDAGSKARQCKRKDPKRNQRPISDFCGGSCGSCECRDNKKYRFNGKNKYTCAFLTKSPLLKARNCKKKDPKNYHKRVSYFCKVSCDSCPAECRDDKNYRFNGIRKNTCKFLTKSPQSKARNCKKKDPKGNHKRVSYFCEKSCGICTVSTDVPTAAPTVFTTGKTGDLCSSSSQCKSGVCRKGTCYASGDCKFIKHDEGSRFDTNMVVIVFVGSGFTNINAWRNQVPVTYKVFNRFKMFEGANTQFVSMYVDILQPSFCDYGCNGLDRLLCCDTPTAKRLASSCFPNKVTLQTVVVHNNKKYGGAGYTKKNVATTSTNPRGPLVAVHELGHSLFQLGDEYSYVSASKSSRAPNCDTRGCSKWSDLIGKFGVRCIVGCSDGGSETYYIGERSFMDELDYPVGDVNTRLTCCTFLAMTKKAPNYCKKYNSGVFKPGHLLNYCKKDHQGYGRVYPAQGNIKGKITHENLSEIPGKLIELENVQQLSFEFDTNYTYKGSSKIISPNLYHKSDIIGSEVIFRDEKGKESLLKITIYFSSGKIRVFFRNKYENIHVPLVDNIEGDYSQEVVDPVLEQVQSRYFNAVLFDNKKGDILRCIIEEL